MKAGRDMIAGTLVAFGRTGSHPGAGMRRGTLILAGGLEDGEDGLLPSFVDSGLGSPPIFGVLARHLEESWRDWGAIRPRNLAGRTWRRYNGDLAEGGLGEIHAPA